MQISLIVATLLSIVSADQLFLQKDSSDKRVIGYYTSWSIYGRAYFPAEIPTDKIDVINYAFANIQGGKMVQGDSYADTQKAYTGDCWDAGCLRGNFNQLNKLKNQTAGLKTMISVGGWTWSKLFSDIAISDATRTTFAQSAVDFVDQWGFDGLDIDWEYPVEGGLDGNDHNPADKENYTALLQKVRDLFAAKTQQNGKQYYLSIASSANMHMLQNYEMTKVAALCDWINLMSYDFHGPWATSGMDNFTDFNSALIEDPKDPEVEWVAEDFNVAAAVAAFVALGVSKSKINVGLPFYGRGFGGVTVDEKNGLFATWKSIPGVGTWANGVFDFWDLNANYINVNGYTRYYDETSKVPYLFNPTSQIMISYDDAQSVASKAQFIIDQDLGGAMFWEFSGDKHSVLLDSLHTTIKGTTPTM